MPGRASLRHTGRSRHGRGDPGSTEIHTERKRDHPCLRPARHVANGVQLAPRPGVCPPEPATLPTSRHLAFAVSCVVTTAVWPVLVARRPPARTWILSVDGCATVTVDFAGLSCWLLIEARDGAGDLGMVERLTSAVQGSSRSSSQSPCGRPLGTRAISDNAAKTVPDAGGHLRRQAEGHFLAVGRAQIRNRTTPTDGLVSPEQQERRPSARSHVCRTGRAVPSSGTASCSLTSRAGTRRLPEQYTGVT
jgi:hypothetical protein